MEVNRLELSSVLEALMEESGEAPNLYFQPPESVKLVYPCIIYKLRTLTSRYADDKAYFNSVSYDVTYITRDSTSKFPVKMLKHPIFAFDRYYVADNLHHYAYTTTNTLKEVSNG